MERSLARSPVIRRVAIALWVVAAVLSVGAQVRGAEECSAAIDDPWGCGSSKVFGPVSLVAGTILFALWTRRSSREVGDTGTVPTLLWIGALLVTLVPFLWLRLAGVT